MNTAGSGDFFVSTNVAFGLGIELGKQINDKNGEMETFNKGGYEIVGYRVSSIYRLDLNYKNATVFLATTLHVSTTKPITSNLATYPSQTIGSIGFRPVTNI